MLMAPPVLPRNFAAFLESWTFLRCRTKIQPYWLRNKKKIQVFDLHTLIETMMVRMVPPVLTRSFAAFWKKNQIFQISHEILYFGRGRKMLYGKI